MLAQPKQKTKFKAVSALAGALLLLLLQTPIALAFGQVTLTVKNPDPYKGNHSWFVYEAQPGETIEDIVSLKNFSPEVATVNIYAVDATSSNGGNFILTFQEDQQQGIGVWANVESQSITINPNQTVDVPFQIQVPASLNPGQYLGGLVAEDSSAADNAKNEKNCPEGELCRASIEVKTRIGSRIYLTIPGQTYEDFSIESFTAKKTITGQNQFQFRITNSGNVAYEPKASISIYDATGNLYEQIEKSLGTSSPETVIEPIVKMKKYPFIGSFTAEATVSFDRKFGAPELHGSSASEKISTSFWVIPWETIIAVLILIAGTALFVWNKKHQRKKFLGTAQSITVEPHQDLVTIANNRNIAWKKLAKYNNLKAPYVIKAGDTLLVPPRSSTPHEDA